MFQNIMILQKLFRIILVPAIHFTPDRIALAKMCSSAFKDEIPFTKDFIFRQVM